MYTAAGKPYTHASEQEWAAKFQIPMASITSFYQLRKDGKKSVTYTWATWEAAQRAAQNKKGESSKKLTRDEIHIVKKAGTPSAAAWCIVDRCICCSLLCLQGVK